MEQGAAEIESRIASRLKDLRTRQELTLDELSRRSGVSRSMISLIERAESSPTANVLDKLSASLGVTLASLFASEEQGDATPVARRADQPEWRDPGTGYIRRNLSPPGFPSPIELVEVVLPAGARVAYDSGFREPHVDQQVFVLEGAIEVTVGEAAHRLNAGDCLAMQLDRPVSFRNLRRKASRHLVALATRRLVPIAAPARRGK
ncbi:MAG: helix-turn-helix transcriptional regulator [Hyphomicrobiales bacterium]|nr:helix-turn-helix transcriptional regulator [Hyphomicrobiales bacterium]